MGKLIEKEIVTKIKMLKEDGEVTVRFNPDGCLVSRSEASANHVTASGPSEEAAINNLKFKISKQINEYEHVISRTKVDLKKYVNVLRHFKKIKREVEVFEEGKK